MVCTHVGTLRMMTYSFPSLVDMLCRCQICQKALSLLRLISYLATHSIFSPMIYIFIKVPSYLSLPVYEMHPKRLNCFRVGTSPVTGGDVWLCIPLRNTAGAKKDGHTSSFYDHNDRFHGEQYLQIAWLDPLTFSNFRDAGQRHKEEPANLLQSTHSCKGCDSERSRGHIRSVHEIISKQSQHKKAKTNKEASPRLKSLLSSKCVFLLRNTKSPGMDRRLGRSIIYPARQGACKSTKGDATSLARADCAELGGCHRGES